MGKALRVVTLKNTPKLMKSKYLYIFLLYVIIITVHIHNIRNVAITQHSDELSRFVAVIFGPKILHAEVSEALFVCCKQITSVV